MYVLKLLVDAETHSVYVFKINILLQSEVAVPVI